MFVSIEEGRQKILDAVTIVPTETIPLGDAYGRVLAMDVVAMEDVPSFDRSPLDGYAFRAEDTSGASKETPVTLKVIDYIPAGDISHVPVTKGTAVRLMTGAPVPEGADCVCKYEETDFTEQEVKIFCPGKQNDNIIRKGEDVVKGTVLAEKGTVIDSGLMGTLAGQNIPEPLVYKQICAGIIATGSELVPVGQEPGPGMIIDTNEYTLTGAMEHMGFRVRRYGIADDTEEAIADILKKAMQECDVILITGGASVGDFDVTPKAMEKAGIRLLFQGVDMKPGKACEYGVCGEKLVCGLSGHPSSSLTNLLLVGLAGLRKMSGIKDYLPKEIDLVLANDFGKQSKNDRVIRGTLMIEDGIAKIRVPKGQGNVMISSTIGSDCVAVVPGGRGPLKAGDKIKGYLI
ncbi:MAG: molybdopterin molybdotransferase MoeA [Lachnospiraceae bacterium]|nr:molybdopterin molybdotransferase MoeA [Lachnospiraceae bacterium]